MILGVVKNSIIDYPGKMSYVIFFDSCLLSCVYCHNKDLKPNELLWWGKILEDIEQQKEFIDAVVFSGGEPTLCKGLKKWVKDIKQMGLLVGLHTSGISHKYQKYVEDDLLFSFDWIGIDYKAPTKELFQQITQTTQSHYFDENIHKIKMLAKNFHNFEVRTTYSQALATKETFDAMQDFLMENHIYTWYIQKCNDYKEIIFSTTSSPLTLEGESPNDKPNLEPNIFNLKDFLRKQTPRLNIKVRTKTGEYSFKDYIK